MKQLLFLLLFPCLAMAQYQGNSGQKITLGEQTTADGLVFRGVASIDTVTATSKITRANKQDTSAYILLDTVTNLLWHYKIGSNAWTQAGGGVSVSSFSAGTTGLTPSTATTGAVTLGGTLAVANGGTGQSTLAAAGINTGSGTLNYLPKYTATGTTLGNSIIFNNESNVGIGTSSPSMKLDVVSASQWDGIRVYNTTASQGADIRVGNDNNNNLGFLRVGGSTSGGNNQNTLMVGTGGGYTIHIAPNGSPAITALSGGNVGIGTTSPAVQFHTTSDVRFAGLASITDLRTDADGDLFNGSDFNLKNSIDTINFGLSDVLKLKPVSFNWNNEGRNISEYKSMGFIAQDVMDVIPNAASTMGDGDMQVDYNAIVATLTKAIQEQQALIKALEQRIINLENK